MCVWGGGQGAGGAGGEVARAGSAGTDTMQVELTVRVTCQNQAWICGLQQALGACLKQAVSMEAAQAQPGPCLPAWRSGRCAQSPAEASHGRG